MVSAPDSSYQVHLPSLVTSLNNNSVELHVWSDLLPEYISAGKNLFLRPQATGRSFNMETIFGSYIFTSIPSCQPENLAKINK